MKKVLMLCLLLSLSVGLCHARGSIDVREDKGAHFDPYAVIVGPNNDTGIVIISSMSAIHSNLDYLLKNDSDGYKVWIASHVNISTATASAPTYYQGQYLRYNIGYPLQPGEKISIDGKNESPVCAYCTSHSSTTLFIIPVGKEPGDKVLNG